MVVRGVERFLWKRVCCCEYVVWIVDDTQEKKNNKIKKNIKKNN